MSINKLVTNDIVSFIMTENCTYKCKHCMREEARPIYISADVIDKFLSQVHLKGIVHLGGGEPLMAIKQLMYLLDQLYDLGNVLERIVVISNLSMKPEVFAMLVEKVDFQMRKNSTQFSFMVSNDFYHTEERIRKNNGVDNLMTMLESYYEVLEKQGMSTKGGPEGLLMEYKSFENGEDLLKIGSAKDIPNATPVKIDYNLKEKVYIKDDTIVGNIQLQPDGRITLPSDMSWSDRDDHYGQKYNCIKRPIRKILQRKQ